jgi:anti-sigma-K factor RskA
MSAIDDHKDGLAAEFVLGTLDAVGRANARMMMAIDPAFAARIAQWERHLGELHALVDPVDPSPHNWEWIKARIAAVRPTPQMWMPTLNEASAASAQPRKPPESEVAAALLALVLHRLLHLLEGAHLDLAHALARDAEFGRQFLERDRIVREPARLEDARARAR